MNRVILIVAAPLAGCAGAQFSDNGSSNSVQFYQTIPALLVTVDADCKVTSQVVSLPGKPRYVSFQSGLGKAQTAVNFGPGGILSSVNVETESQAEDALKIAQAVMGAAAGAAFTGEGSKGPEKKVTCTPGTGAYPINPDGTIGNTPIFHPDLRQITNVTVVDSNK